MEFHSSEIAPAMRNIPPEKHHYVVQAMLMGRDPAGEADWSERYAEKFRRLYDTDEEFRALVQEQDLTDETLTRIQQRLDQHPHDKAA